MQMLSLFAFACSESPLSELGDHFPAPVAQKLINGASSGEAAGDGNLGISSAVGTFSSDLVTVSSQVKGSKDIALRT